MSVSRTGAGAEFDDDLVVRRCASEHVAVIEADEPRGRLYARTTFARQEAGLCIYLVAWVHGKAVGSGEVETGPQPELKNLHVAAASRGRGIGTALIREAEKAAGSERLRIGVAEDNPRAFRLYERLGYMATGESTTYSYEYVDDDGATRRAVETSVHLEKSLAPLE